MRGVAGAEIGRAEEEPGDPGGAGTRRIGEVGRIEATERRIPELLRIAEPRSTIDHRALRGTETLEGVYRDDPTAVVAPDAELLDGDSVLRSAVRDGVL